MVFEAIDKYNKKFKNGFPTIPLLESETDEKIIEMIENCIKNNKDVYEMGYLILVDTTIEY